MARWRRPRSKTSCRRSMTASTTSCCRPRHRVRPRYSQCQHADRAPRRHVRTGAAVSASRPGRALETARLCAVHAAGPAEDHRAGRAAIKGAAITGNARRRLPSSLLQFARSTNSFSELAKRTHRKDIRQTIEKLAQRRTIADRLSKFLQIDFAGTRGERIGFYSVELKRFQMVVVN